MALTRSWKVYEEVHGMCTFVVQLVNWCTVVISDRAGACCMLCNTVNVQTNYTLNQNQIVQIVAISHNFTFAWRDSNGHIGFQTDA